MCNNMDSRPLSTLIKSYTHFYFSGSRNLHCAIHWYKLYVPLIAVSHLLASNGLLFQHYTKHHHKHWPNPNTCCMRDFKEPAQLARIQIVMNIIE